MHKEIPVQPAECRRPNRLEPHAPDVRVDVVRHEIPIRRQGRGLDLQGVGVEPVAEVLRDGDSAPVDVDALAGRDARRVAGLLRRRLRCEASGPLRLAHPCPFVGDPDDKRPGAAALHHAVTQRSHQAASPSAAT